jgi:ATP-dependent RNA helicase DDX51/DBP6
VVPLVSSSRLFSQGVDAVVSYDTPVYLKTYVHRVGRTARAGRAGQAFTLLRPQEVRHFKAMLSKADTQPVLAHTVSPQEMEAVAPACAQALAHAEAALAKPGAPLKAART